MHTQLRHHAPGYPEPGEALDTKIAQFIMGWKIFRTRGETWACTAAKCTHDKCTDGHSPMYGDRQMGRTGNGGWSPSRTLAQAFEIIARLNELEWTAGLEQIDTPEGLQWRCDLHRADPYGVADGIAPTPEHAICRAALETIGQ